MAKREHPQPKRPVSRRQLARWEKERRIQRAAIIAGIIAILIIIAIPVYGYVAFIVLPPLHTVVKVNDASYNMGYYVKLLRMYKLGQESAGQQPDWGTIPFQLLNILEDNELIRQAAARLNISVSQDEVTQEIKNRLLPPPQEGQETSPETLQREYQERLRQYLYTMRLNEKEYRNIVRDDLLREKLRDLLGQDVPTVAKQVHFKAIAVADQDKATEVAKKLEEGTDFADLVKEYSLDPDSTDTGGDMGWVPERINPELDAYLFGMVKDEVSYPIHTPDGVYILKVLDKSGDQAHLQAILVDSEDAALTALSRIKNGEDFTAVSREVSKDPALKTSGGDMGWVALGTKGGDFDEVVFGLSPGKLSQPLTSTEAVYLLMVVERADARAIDDNNREVLKTRALEDWLLAERSKNKLSRSFNSDQYSWAIDQVTKGEKQ